MENNTIEQRRDIALLYLGPWKSLLEDVELAAYWNSLGNTFFRVISNPKMILGIRISTNKVSCWAQIDQYKIFKRITIDLVDPEGPLKIQNWIKENMELDNV